MDGLCFGFFGGGCTHRNGLLGRVWKLREKKKTAGDLTRLKFAMHPRSASDTTEQSSRTSFLHQRVSFVAYGHETLKKVHYSLLFHDNGATCMFMHFKYHMTIRQAYHESRW